MEKKEYVTPEMEIVEIAEKYGIMAGGSTAGGDFDDEDPRHH